LFYWKHYFDKTKESSELGSNVQQEASVSSKPFDITLIASVGKDGSSMLPVVVVDEVLLVEYFVAIWLEGEVV
jgi:hypothetical protein